MPCGLRASRLHSNENARLMSVLLGVDQVQLTDGTMFD